MIKSFQILGYCAGMPTAGNNVSCIILSTNKYDIMLDCGEDSFRSYINNSYLIDRLKYIFITHMHPDHTGGLVNLLFYRKIMNIKSNLLIWGPRNLSRYLQQCFIYQKVNIDYKLIINSISDKKIIIDNDIEVNSKEMNHNVECHGYSFNDNKNKFTFITDTRPNKNAVILAKHSDVLVHESTFSDKCSELAFNSFHSTISDAKEVASKAKVKRLILTHFNNKFNFDDREKITFNNNKCVILDKKYFFNNNEN